ncbi:MAG: hypothetical protein KME06_09420 [Kastovskya adunca ATA6-11-RM4]|jgi:hypothetical protein|nr:hypothetical protein [Kastovskya adunca ATA6-11-RM4]
MTNYKLTINVGAINAATEKAFAETALLLGRKFSEVITEPRTWAGWSGPLDIVDTGRLRSSQQMVFASPTEAVFAWSLEYAAPVHEGYVTKNGTQIPGRPWTQIAQQEMNVQETFAVLYRQQLR